MENKRPEEVQKESSGSPKKTILLKKTNFCRKCCVFGCPSNSLHDSCDGVSFHPFPINEAKRDEWIRRTQVTVETELLWICSLHFSPCHMTTVGERTILKTSAVPDLNLPKVPSESTEPGLTEDPLRDHRYWNMYLENSSHPHSCHIFPSMDHNYGIVFKPCYQTLLLKKFAAKRKNAPKSTKAGNVRTYNDDDCTIIHRKVPKMNNMSEPAFDPACVPSETADATEQGELQPIQYEFLAADPDQHATSVESADLVQYEFQAATSDEYIAQYEVQTSVESTVQCEFQAAVPARLKSTTPVRYKFQRGESVQYEFLSPASDTNDHQNQSTNPVLTAKSTYRRLPMGSLNHATANKKLKMSKQSAVQNEQQKPSSNLTEFSTISKAGKKNQMGLMLLSLDPGQKIHFAIRKHQPSFRVLYPEFAFLELYLIEILKAALIAEKASITMRKWSLRVKILFTIISMLSPRGRDVLKKFMKLPEPPIVQVWQKLLPFPRPGLDPSIAKILQEVGKNMDPLNRYCALSYGEISIRRRVELDAFWDALGGYATLSDCSLKHARFAFVFMAHGLQENWKIPVALYYSNVMRSSSEITRMIFEVMDFLELADFQVVATITTTRLYNYLAVKTLTATTNHYFERNGRKVFTIFDPRYLVRSTKDLLFSRSEARVQFGPGVFADGNDIKIFFEADNLVFTRRLAPKLTEAHFNLKTDSKNMLRHSLEMFSNTVHSAMYARQAMGLDAQLTETADFILVIDELYDSLNGTSMDAPELKPCKSAIHDTSRHREFWTHATDWISKWRIISKNTKKRRKKVLTPRLWITSLNAVLGLWDFLQPLGFKCLPTAWLNLQPLEEFFDSITNKFHFPTPFQFQRAFKSSMMTMLTSVYNATNHVLLNPERLLELYLQEISEAFRERGTQPQTVPIIPADFSDKMINWIYEECKKLTSDCSICIDNMTTKPSSGDDGVMLSADFIATTFRYREIFEQAKTEGHLYVASRPIKLLQDKMKAEDSFTWASCVIHQTVLINGFTYLLAVILLRGWCQLNAKKTAISEKLNKKNVPK